MMNGPFTAVCRTLLIGLVVTGISSAAGQELPPATIPPAPTVATEAPISSPGIGDHCCPNYWIISSRHCAQKPGRCPAFCDFDVYHAHGTELYCTSLSEFLGALEPSVPVCIVIHGSFVNWTSVLNDSHYTYRWLRAAAPERPLHVVFFTWPSDEWVFPSLRLSIFLRGQRSSFNGVYLAQLIGRIPPEHPISLFGHSHGARVIASALHLLGGGCVQGERLTCVEYQGHRLRAIFAAAAVEHDWLNPGEQYELALWRAECLVNLRNRKDLALGLYPWVNLFAEHTLGRRGFTPDDRCQLGRLNPKTVEIDVTNLLRHHHVWPAYYSHPQIADALVPYIYFVDAAELQAERAVAPQARRSAPVLQRESTRLNPFNPRRYW